MLGSAASSTDYYEMMAPTQDFRYALRVLRRSPGFTIAAVLVLALAMGATSAIFSVVEAVLLRPLPYNDCERLCVLWKTVPARNIDWDWTSYPTIRDWRDQNHVFEDLTVILRPEGSQVTLPSGTGLEKLQGSKVFANFFEILGVRPMLGRTFSDDEGRRGDDVAVLSYGFWQRRFGSDKNVLGRTLRLSNRNTTIIGVMPPNFQFPDKKAQLWLLLTADSNWPLFQQPRFRISDAFCALGRLKRGVSMEQARAEMRTISARLARQFPATDAGLEIRVMPLPDLVTGPRVRRALWVLAGAVLCVLLIACSNIASMLVARGAARRMELAVRAALGASRGRLVWQLASENILLSLAGGLVGLLFARLSLRALVALAPADLPRSDGIGINITVLAATFALCFLTGVVFGLLPALQIAEENPHSRLCDGGRGASAGLGDNRIRGLLVSLQFALATMLLSGAGLLLRSFLLLNAIQPGFDLTHLLTTTVELPCCDNEKYKSEIGIRTFFEEAVQRSLALPGVRGVAVGSADFSIFTGNTPNQSIVIEGQPVTQDLERHERNLVSDSYFNVMGIPLYQGRLFSPEDVHGGRGVAVINRSMALRYWPSENAIGKRFKEVLPSMDPPWLTVVGVVGDVSLNRDGSVIPVFYQPIRQWSLPRMSLVVRTAGDPLSLAPAVRRAVQSVDTTLPYFDIGTVEHGINELDRPRRFQTALIGLFAASALILAAVGLFGLMTYSVEQRTREIGIRIALGATSGSVMRLVLRKSLIWVSAGTAIGIAGAVAFGRALSALLFGITATDPGTLASVISVLAAVTAFGCLFPTRRVAKVDPNVALRHD